MMRELSPVGQINGWGSNLTLPASQLLQYLKINRKTVVPGKAVNLTTESACLQKRTMEKPSDLVQLYPSTRDSRLAKYSFKCI